MASASADARHHGSDEARAAASVVVAAAGRLGRETSMKDFVRRPLSTAVVAGVLGLALQGCNPTAAPPAVSAPVQVVSPHDEAARLIKTLDLSTYQQDSVRDYVAAQIARGVAAKPALERWILEQRDRGAAIRCKPQVSATDECVART